MHSPLTQRKLWTRLALVVLVAAALVACSTFEEPEAVVVTATPDPAADVEPTAVVAEEPAAEEAPAEEAPAEEAPAEEAPAEEAPAEEAPAEEAPAGGEGDLGFPGNPVLRNAQWTPRFEEFAGHQWAFVPVGCFEMGSLQGDNLENVVHEQCIEQPYWIMVTEVTNEQFGVGPTWTDPSFPRTNVSMFDASAYCQSIGGSLPNEVQWEYAARGPSSFLYPYGDTGDDDLNLSVNAVNSTSPRPVGERPAGVSWVGALDMSGNAREWTISAYTGYPYVPGDGRESLSDDANANRVLRGGGYLTGWANASGYDREFADWETDTLADAGFRCVAPVE
ncbi:MAG: formylglycine-generating enzyme family protein [Chloroflexi bacterium]|nr:formylglycine-generating enzyme family protein [Chloroflexota bacterium]